jgi:hypothetical protein
MKTILITTGKHGWNITYSDGESYRQSKNLAGDEMIGNIISLTNCFKDYSRDMEEENERLISKLREKQQPNQGEQ